MDREALEQRYQMALERALGEPGMRASPPEMAPRLPPAIRETMLAAALVAGELPEALAQHYLERAPRDLALQRFGGDDPARALLWRPLEASRVPGFAGAIDGACALLREQGLDPREVLGAASAQELLRPLTHLGGRTGGPSALELAQRSLLASGLPLLGAGPGERVELERALTGESLGQRLLDADAVFDQRLGQQLAHELLHGLRREIDGPPPPWMVCEAAAIWLQARAAPRHVFPEVAGEAVPGVSLFVLVAEGLAAALGAGALLSVLAAPQAWSARVGRPIAEALACAEWQLWLQGRSAPFARDALRAEAWVKLLFAARDRMVADGEDSDPEAADTIDRRRHPERAPLDALLREVEEQGALAAASRLPSLLEAAEAIPWRALSWWHRVATADDERSARMAVRALFQENALAPIFVTRPSELPDGRLWLDVEACSLRASPRARGAFAEPARWIWPPPLCRELAARGLERVEIRGAKREQADALAAALVALGRTAGACPRELVLEAAAMLSTASPPSLRVASNRQPPADLFTQVLDAGHTHLRAAALGAAEALGLFELLAPAPPEVAPMPLDAEAIAEQLERAGRAHRLSRHRLAALLDVLVLEGALQRMPGAPALYACAWRPPRTPPLPAQGWGLLRQVIESGVVPAEPGVLGVDGHGCDSLQRFHAHLREAGAAAANELMGELARCEGGTLLDLGSGAGIYAQAWLEARGDVRAVLLDRSAVLALAEDALAAHLERCELRAADLLLDDTPWPRARVVLLANLLHLVGPEEAQALVTRAAAAAAPGGLVVIKDLLLEPDASGTRAGLYFSLNMALFTERGRVHDRAALRTFLERAGLVEIELRTLASGPDSIVAQGRVAPTAERP